MIVLKNYILDINSSDFIFKDIYGQFKKNLTPLLVLKKVYILDKTEIIDYLKLKNCLVINLELEHNFLIFIFVPNKDIEQYMKNILMELNETDVIFKAIPILKQFSSIFFKNNIPIIINKYFNISKYLFNNSLELRINLNQTIPKLFLKQLFKKNGKIFFAITSTHKKNEERYICYLGIDNISKFLK